MTALSRGYTAFRKGRKYRFMLGLLFKATSSRFLKKVKVTK